MNKISHIFTAILALTLIVVSSCEDQDKLHNIWLQDGEINYIGKVDSLQAFSGNERVEFQIYLSDPRAKYLTISWNEFGTDRLTRVPVPEHEIDEPFSIILGSEVNILENEYTFSFVSDDDAGTESVAFEALGKVLGSKYQASLSNRIVVNFEEDDGGIYLEFSPGLNTDDQGIELTYNNGIEDLILVYTAEELNERIFLNNPDFSTPISYSTIYQPENSIDAFKAEVVIPSIERQDNIALGKPVTASGMLNDNDFYRPSNAVDGRTSGDDTRWINFRLAGPHWIEIDLQGTFPIEKVIVRDDTPIQNFLLEVEVDGVWQVLENATDDTDDAFFESIYDNPVNASKIRYSFVTENDPDIIRMFEFEVYSTVKIQ